MYKWTIFTFNEMKNYFKIKWTADRKYELIIKILNYSEARFFGIEKKVIKVLMQVIELMHIVPGTKNLNSHLFTETITCLKQDLKK